MGKVVRWSELPEELVDSVANRLSSNIDLLHIRSICKPWRSAVAAKKRILKRKHHFLLPKTFFRVTHPSSCPHKGWLIKTIHDYEESEFESGMKNKLVSPCSGPIIIPTDQTLDLLNFTVSEIRQSYKNQESPLLGKTVVIEDWVFAMSCPFKLTLWCKNGESTSWTRIRNEQVEHFSNDIIPHKGAIYAIGLHGAVWEIRLPQLNIFQYGPSTPKRDNNFINCFKEKRLVEYSGELCVVHRFRDNRVKRGRFLTLGFKVYKMDKESVRWVTVDSLGDKALIVDTDCCFTVLSSEYYGCLENAIYFSDSEDDVGVFKLDDGSIITKKMADSSSSTSHKSCFQMFSAPFL